MNTKPITLIWHILLIAVIYAITGRIGQLVGIPPGNVTLVWLPSGIAFIALLYLGNYSVVGIWLGAFLTNTWAFWDPSSMQSMLNAAAIGSMIGIGSFLQPLCGKRLLRLQEHPRNIFSSPTRIYRFLAIIPVMSVVSSSIGTLTLCLSDSVQWSAFWSVWQTWWTGDSIGILLVVPLVSYWTVELRHVSFKKKLILLFPILLSVGIILWIFFSTKAQEMSVIQSSFSTEAEKEVTSIERRLKQSLKHIDALAGLISVVGDSITREQFQAYCKIITEQTPSIQAMEWVPIISHGQRKAFEQMATKTWDHLFEIKEKHHKQMVSAKKRETYTPVYLVEPFEGNEAALGYDLASNPDRLQSLDQAIRLKQKPLSPPIILVQETAQSYGFLYLVPVTFLQTILDPQQTVSGVALGVFRVNTLLSNLGKHFYEHKVNSRIIDKDLTTKQQTIIFEQRPTQGLWIEQPLLFEHHENINIQGRQWTFHFWAGEAFIPKGSFMLAKVVLVGGLAFCALLTFLLIIRLGRNKADHKYKDELKQQVQDRTKQLNNVKEAAEAANRAKSVFLANMSHELRTPLNAILGFSEMLGYDPDATASQQEKLAIINRSGGHLLSMINDVLDLSKIEAGRVELEPEAFDLPLMLEDIGHMFQQRTETAGLHFNLDLDPLMPRYIKTDVGKLRQILINLLGNAVKFTHQGTVSLCARAQSTADDPTMCMLQLEIKDSGPGIAQQQLQSIFQPFVQAGGSKSNIKGTGLGLAISKSFVDLMGGDISVESEPGKGSLFCINLPVALAESAKTTGTEAARPVVLGLETGQPDWRILVVEDSQENRLLLSSLLVEAGFDTKDAENGKQAIDLFQQWQPHFIWMDMSMPVMDGYEATARIRQLPGGDAVKIVAITASAFKEQRQKILESGCNDVTHKPFQAHEIFDMMSELLGVSYIYEEKVEAAPATVLTAEMMTNLSADLKQELKKVTLSLDNSEIIPMIDRIRTDHPEIADGLLLLIDGYRHDLILELLEDTEKNDD